jgi:hypothetical protein
MQFLRMIAASFMFAVSLAAPSLSLAQQTSPKGMEIDESQLRSFARAYTEVQKMREVYEPQLGTTQDPQKANDIER